MMEDLRGENIATVLLFIESSINDYYNLVEVKRLCRNFVQLVESRYSSENAEICPRCGVK